jgi:hypothetical protein
VYDTTVSLGRGHPYLLALVALELELNARDIFATDQDRIEMSGEILP